MNFLSFFTSNEYTIKHYQKNEMIKNEGDQCNEIGYIISGNVNIYSALFSDESYLINHLIPKSTFGESIIFSKDPTYLGNIICNKECDIAFINKQMIINKLENNSFRSFFIELLSNKTMLIQNRVKILSQKSIKEKILFYLSQEYKKNKSKVIAIPSKQRLAEILNIPRPSLSRELIKLKENNIIDYNKYFIKIL